jgi:hypothetical protein
MIIGTLHKTARQVFYLERDETFFLWGQLLLSVVSPPCAIIMLPLRRIVAVVNVAGLLALMDGDCDLLFVMRRVIFQFETMASIYRYST